MNITRLVTPITQHEKIPAPQVPTPETLRNPRLTFRDATGSVLVTYCPATCSGGVFFAEVGMWRIYTPISPGEFLRAVQKQGFKFPSEFIEAAWISEAGAGHA